MSSLLREIFKDITNKDTCYHDIYYLTDTEVKFSINDDLISRVLTYSIRNENKIYNVYSFEKSKITNTIIRHEIKKDIKNKKEFWIWYSNFYNNLN